MKMTGAIAMGGNLPYGKLSPEENISRALHLCESKGIRVTAMSSIWRTPCFPANAGPDFANAVARIEFDGSPKQVLAICHEVEAQFGRTREARWSARTMDVDLLFADDVVLPDPATVKRWINLPNDVSEQPAPDQILLPHPRMQDRGFVLVPLAEVAADWRHPILGLTVMEMKNRLPEAEIQAIQRISAADPAI